MRPAFVIDTETWYKYASHTHGVTAVSTKRVLWWGTLIFMPGGVILLIQPLYYHVVVKRRQTQEKSDPESREES